MCRYMHASADVAGTQIPVSALRGGSRKDTSTQDHTTMRKRSDQLRSHFGPRKTCQKIVLYIHHYARNEARRRRSPAFLCCTPSSVWGRRCIKLLRLPEQHLLHPLQHGVPAEHLPRGCIGGQLLLRPPVRPAATGPVQPTAPSADSIRAQSPRKEV
jgi:hypothetical protein